MIESYYWREKLQEEIRWLRKNQKYKRWSEKQMVLYERKLMLVSFQIRSLLERPKVAKAYATKELEVKRYEKVGKKPLTELSMSHFHELFNMHGPKFDLLSAPQLCNQLIHYYFNGGTLGRETNFYDFLGAAFFLFGVLYCAFGKK